MHKKKKPLVLEFVECLLLMFLNHILTFQSNKKKIKVFQKMNQT
jgi:hypothetical protein